METTETPTTAEILAKAADMADEAAEMIHDIDMVDAESEEADRTLDQAWDALGSGAALIREYIDEQSS